MHSQNVFRCISSFSRLFVFLKHFSEILYCFSGIDVHFVHVKPVQKSGQTVLPLMMVHGWPGTFYEFYGILPLLTETDSDVVFEVICPSIPGYGYSEAPHKKGKSTNLQQATGSKN